MRSLLLLVLTHCAESHVAVSCARMVGPARPALRMAAPQLRGPHGLTVGALRRATPLSLSTTQLEPVVQVYRKHTLIITTACVASSNE